MLALAAVVGGILVPGPVAGNDGQPSAVRSNWPAGEAATPAEGNWPGAVGMPVPPAGARDTGAADAVSDQVGAEGTAGAPRASLLALAQPLWTELTAAQQSALRPFADEWNTWSAAEKRSWVALADRLPRMDPAKREKAQQRIVEWARFSPEARRTARANYRLAKERSPDTRVSEWERYRSMTQEQQSVLRQAGSTSNTAAGHAGAPTGLAKEAAQPLPRQPPPQGTFTLVPAVSGPAR
jgi:hypothetical protein